MTGIARVDFPFEISIGRMLRFSIRTIDRTLRSSEIKLEEKTLNPSPRDLVNKVRRVTTVRRYTLTRHAVSRDILRIFVVMHMATKYDRETRPRGLF